MYYVFSAANRAEGPYPAEWIRRNAKPDTLVSNGQTWVRYAEHPDFLSAAPPLHCSQCSGDLSPLFRYCPSCGHIANGALLQSRLLPQKSFQHPLDVAAIQILSHTPGLDLLAKLISGALIERLMNIRLVGHAVRVGADQYLKSIRCIW